MSMSLRNTETRYGLPAILFHWVTALAVFGLFGLGLWMTGLEDYYHPWYRKGPELHKGIGLLLFGLTVLRLGWALANARPAPPPHSPAWERAAARLAHAGLYLLLFALIASGYLISTADGRAISLFGLLEIPALPWAIDGQADLAGQVHAVLAFSLIGLVLIHALAALKHHHIDRDDTLRRMLGLKPTSLRQP